MSLYLLATLLTLGTASMSSASAQVKQTSYYPGVPLGPIGSAAEDAKCAADDRCTGSDKDHNGRYDYLRPQPAEPKPQTPAAKPPPAASVVAKAAGVVERAYLTGYSLEDNTPRGSRDISNPVIHKMAAGTGTFRDPITLAVGHSINPTKMRFPAGTKFYVPLVRAYFIVEDKCGDGDTPQDGGCWIGYPPGASYWLDLYVGSDPNDACMNKLTGVHTVIRNPDSRYAAVARPGDSGSTYLGIGAGCRTFSDTPVRSGS